MLTIEEIQKYISEDKSSEKKRLARKGQNYYEGKHDIRNYRLFYYDSDGILKEDKYRSNVKIPHPFFTELVDQAVQYIFSGEQFAKSELPELQAKLDEYFNYNENFTANISDLLRGCIAKGFEYMYAYKDEDDRLAFQCTDSLGVIEIRKNNTDSRPEYVIYCYTDRVDKNHKEIKRIQVWDNSQVWYYVQDGYGKISLDESAEMNPKPHNLYTKNDGKTYKKSFGFIPFFRMDNNKRQVSDLKIIKDGESESTFILTGTTKGSWLELEQLKEKIRSVFTDVGLTAILTHNIAIAVMYAGSMPVPTGTDQLKRIQINLKIKEWRVV